jgi:hypothetical protein
MAAIMYRMTAQRNASLLLLSQSRAFAAEP